MPSVELKYFDSLDNGSFGNEEGKQIKLEIALKAMLV